jgi:ATP-dependent DNA helicase RecG
MLRSLLRNHPILNRNAMPNSNATEYKSLSQRAKQLLAREEGFDVDFKRSVSAVEADDIVAFANSKAGGAILIGVDESKNPDGRQIGVVVGCAVGDPEKRKILDKAHQCVPPVEVTVHVENRRDKPFYRVEIPSGPNKPYCSSGGTYKIRGDGRKNTLYPTSLLTLFLETEGGEFLRRFQQATSSLEQSVEETKKRIVTELGDLASSVAQMEFNIDQSLARIAATADDAADSASSAIAASEDASQVIQEVHSLIERMESTAEAMRPTEQRLDAIIEHFGVEHWKTVALRNSVKALVAALSLRAAEMGHTLTRRSLVAMIKRMGTTFDHASVVEWIGNALEEPAVARRALEELEPLEKNLMMMIRDDLLKRQKSIKRKQQGKLIEGESKVK